jgi:hypothetical protein
VSLSIQDRPPINRELADKGYIPALERFKRYMEQRGNKRIPMIVKELLSQQDERKMVV